MLLYHFIVYYWYCNIKPVCLVIAAGILSLFGACILYAEFAIFVGINDSLIYNLLDVAGHDAALSYFESNVTLPNSIIALVLLSDSTSLFSIHF